MFPELDKAYYGLRFFGSFNETYEDDCGYKDTDWDKFEFKTMKEFWDGLKRTFPELAKDIDDGLTINTWHDDTCDESVTVCEIQEWDEESGEWKTRELGFISWTPLDEEEDEEE